MTVGGLAVALSLTLWSFGFPYCIHHQPPDLNRGKKTVRRHQLRMHYDAYAPDKAGLLRPRTDIPASSMLILRYYDKKFNTIFVKCAYKYLRRFL